MNSCVMFRTTVTTIRQLCACLALWLAVSAMFSSSAQAAGCHVGTGYPSFTSDLPDGVIQVYADGKLRQFRPATLPCSGPFCKGSKPSGVAAPVVTVPDDRSDSVSLRRSSVGGFGRSHSYFDFEFTSLYARLACVDILRPPRA